MVSLTIPTSNSLLRQAGLNPASKTLSLLLVRAGVLKTFVFQTAGPERKALKQHRMNLLALRRRCFKHFFFYQARPAPVCE